MPSKAKGRSDSSKSCRRKKDSQSEFESRRTRVALSIWQTKLPVMDKSRSNVLLRWWPLLAVAYCIAMLQRMAPASLSHEIVQLYQLDWDLFGYFSTVYLLAYMLLQLPGGIATDYYGPRRILLFSIATSAAGTLLMAFASGYGMLLTGRAFSAVGDAMVYSVLIKATAALSSKQRFPIMMSLGQMAGYLGVALATSPLLFIGMHLGLQWTFVVICVALLLVGLAVLCLTSQQDFIEPDIATKGRKLTPDIGALLRCKPTLVAFSAYYTAYMVLFASWGAIFLSQGFQMSAYDSTSFVLLGVLGTVAGGLINGLILSKPIPRSLPLVVAALFAMGLFGMIGLADAEPGQRWIFYVGFGGIGLCFGAISNSIASNVRDRAGTASLSFVSAMHAIAGNAVAGIVMPFFGRQLEYGSLHARYVLIGAELTCTGLVLLAGFYLFATRKNLADSQ